MELIYLWINGYKNLENVGILLNSSYSVDFIQKNGENKRIIQLSEKKNYVNIFGDNLNISVIVGKNGSGKTNVINALSAILRSITDVHTSFPLKKDFYDDSAVPQEYCLVVKKDDKYIAYCSNMSEFILKMQTKKGDVYDAEYKDVPNANIIYRKCMTEQSGNEKCYVAKFIPFFKDEETNYPEFSLWNGIYAITNIKIRSYFYYDRFRLYDAVRNLIELYIYNMSESSKKEELKLFNDNQNLFFDYYSPYLNIDDGLHWVNSRIQNEKDDNYEIAAVISNSVRGFSRHIKNGSYKSIEDILNNILPKLFFAYALGEILVSVKKPSYKIALGEHIKKQIAKLTENDYSVSANRKNFYDLMETLVKEKRLKDLLKAYIQYEGGKKEGSGLKKMLEQYYELIFDKDSKKLVLQLKSENLEEIKNIDRLPDYITNVEKLKGIGKNLYKKGANGGIYDYMSLSTGEQRILKLMADIYLVSHINNFNKNSNIPDVNIFLFDESDLSWHPEWQRKMIYYVKDLFDRIIQNNKSRIFNLVFTTHSPIILSDMPKDNVNFLNINKNVNNIETFGANIHDLYDKGLFFDCPDCLPMGEFAKTEINKIIEDLKNDNHKINQKILEAKINIIGEPMLKNMLLEMLYKKEDYLHKDEKCRILQNENMKLKIELQQYKDKYEKNCNTES